MSRSLAFGALSIPLAAWDADLWWLGVLTLTLIAAVLIVGVANIRSGVFLETFYAGRRDGAEVALTFEDGPDPEWTPRVLSILASRGVRATFFVVGRRVEAHPTLIMEILAGGHEVALHTYDHGLWYPFRSPTKIRDDLRRGVAALVRAGAPEPRWFRPPNGLITPSIAQEVARAGLRVAGWTIRPWDGVRTAPEVVVRRVTRALRGGDVVLLHDARSLYGGAAVPPAVVALPAILDALDARRLRAVTLSEFESLSR